MKIIDLFVTKIGASAYELDCGNTYFGVPENGRLNLL